MQMGYVDIAQRDRIVGWAADPDAPDEALELVVLVNGHEAGRAKADRFRPDLKRLGKFGEGRHGFEFKFEPPLDPAKEFRVVVRFAAAEAVPIRGAFRFPRQGGADPAPAVEFYQPSQRPAASGAAAPVDGPRTNPKDEAAAPKPVGTGNIAAPRTPRELFRLLAGYPEAGDDLARLFDRVDLAGVTPAQVHHAAFQRAPPRFRNAWADRYDAKAGFVGALASPEFRARAIELFLGAFPEKPRLFFIHVPKCAGTDLRAKLLPGFASLQHSLASQAWTPDHDLFAALGTAAGAVDAGKEILVFGHIELNRYVAMAGTRAADRIFTVIRDPVEIAISQANYAVTVLVDDPEAKVPHTSENLRKLGIERLPPDLSPEQLKQLALRAFLDSKITQPNLICSYLAGFGKGHAEAVRNIVTHNIEVTDTAHYNRWLKERWGIDSATRHNASRPFLTRADLEPYRDHLARLTGEDHQVFELISWALTKAGTVSIGGLELLDMAARDGGPYAVDFERDLIVRRPTRPQGPAPALAGGGIAAAGSSSPAGQALPAADAPAVRAPRPGSGTIAIVTMVYNESVNLPIWLNHYRRTAPSAALFVIDHSSDDGSTDHLPGVSKIPLPRRELDERDRAFFVTSLQQALLRYYDVVIYTDCDELLVPDPAKSATLEAHLRDRPYAYAAPIGVNVIHIIEREPPIDFTQPLLRQRRYGQFHSMLCKPLVTRVPLNWQPGFHACERQPVIDRDLYLFHTKRIDRDRALQRQQVVRNLAWSERALETNASAHHRYEDERMMRELFLDPAAQLRQQQGAHDFVFDAEIARLQNEIRQTGGIFHMPTIRGPIVEIPEAFRGAF